MTGKGIRDKQDLPEKKDRPDDSLYAEEARVYGIVQGVGFRPTVSRHALACQVAGSVSNMGPYVEIFAQGPMDQVNDFLDRVRHRPPERAVILRMDRRECRPRPDCKDFEIVESEKREGQIFVSPDIGICDRCREEMYDPGNRRYLHPFINCTCCGPRLTILDSMPYDRVRTSMADFPMCPDCEYEYTHPETRRYDAQPVCCNDCGPEVYLLGRKERGAEAIRLTRKIIRDGGIAAIKGIGGFHLCCDASSQEAVEKLRRRKQRPRKPFAVMMKNIDVVGRECLLFPEGEEILTGHQKPILLLEARSSGRVCRAVAPDNPKLGVMLPYAPIQHLLFDYKDDVEVSDCLVMTSANVSGAPICRDDEGARAELFSICDVILSHDRLIRIRADDTVMDYDQMMSRPYMIRRSRGYAPLPVMISKAAAEGILAVGGELKNTFCIGKGDLLYPSPYIGDMTDARTVEALSESVVRMEELLESKTRTVVCDLHPRYNTGIWAEKLAEERGIPLLRIQHHYAHILSCMAENDWSEPVIGVAMDGTGYGTDGTVWGGEILLSSMTGFRRLASLDPFIQTGGDRSSIEGWRIAVDLIFRYRQKDQKDQKDQMEETAERIESLGLCSKKEALILHRMGELGVNSVVSTSAGRLFDAVSAILGICRESTFEGEAATCLQFAAERWESQHPDAFSQENEEKDREKEKAGISAGDMEKQADYTLESKMGDQAEDDSEVFHMPTQKLVEKITEAYLAGADRDRLAWEFHRDLSGMIVEACKKARAAAGLNTVALSGGCYQNMLLLRLCRELLIREGFRVLTHSMVPPNDGGICLGQAYGAAGLIMARQPL